MSDLDLHDLPPPPPAYSEENFDKKVSTAVELSLSTPQPHHDEAWETWDDEAFKAAAAQALASSKPYSPIEKQTPILPRTQGGSSHLNPTALPYQPIRPLKINKRTVDPNPSKPPPNWFENQESINPRQAPSVSHDVAGLRYSSRQLPSPDDLSVHPPPPAFTPEGPSLDGPPYEQVVRSSWPGSRSRGPSPHHHVPRLPQTQQHYTQRHSQYPSHRLTSPTSISMFDPSIAYHQESNIITPQPEQEQEEQEEQYIPDAACLYNSAVASHLSTTPRHTQTHRGGQQLMSCQSPREIFPSHLSPVRVGQAPLPGMAPAQNPAAQRFSTYSLYHHAAMTGLRNERHVASLHYRPGDG